MRHESKLRRVFLVRLIQLPLVGIVFRSTAAAAGPSSCVDLDALDGGELAMRDSLGYAEGFPDKTKRCHSCAFFNADSTGTCGNCTILHGPVSAEGHCSSWAKR